MDRTDRRILHELQENPEISAVDLAKAVGLSHTPCWRRLKKLESDGVIEGRATLLNPAALNLNVVVFANLRLKQHDEETLEALEQVAREMPQITDCYSMSGDSDYLLRIIVPNIDEYETFLKKVILHLPGIAYVNSHFALKSIKKTTRLPIKIECG